MTLQDCEYENLKLKFVAELRKRIKCIQQHLTNPDDFAVFSNDNSEADTFQKCLDFQLFIFFYPFTELLEQCLDSGFARNNQEEVDFDWIKAKFIDMTKFLLTILEPTSKIMSESIKAQDYYNLLTRFDMEIVSKFCMNGERG